MTMNFSNRLLMIGCGNMAGQMLNRWLECGLSPARVTVVRPSGQPVAQGIEVLTQAPDEIASGTIVLLGMKPYQLSDVAASLKGLLGAHHIIASVLAGTKQAQLRDAFPDVSDIVRIMPNTPVGVGQGVCALFADDATSESARGAIYELMQPLGLAEWIGSESQFNLVTALSGCGPAYLFRFIDALAKAAAQLGLPDAQAGRLALATVQGASTLAAQSSESPGKLADRVASPGGMTRQGMNVLDDDDRLVKLLTDTLRAARDRGDEMERGA